MKKTNVGVILVGILAILVVLCVTSYNGMVAKKEKIDNELSNLNVSLQRRADLIPNLISTVKGYTKYEENVVNKVLEARDKLVKANSIEDKSSANNELSESLKSLMVVVENYPDLKASQNFVSLQDELAGTENRIAVARKNYNDAVKEYNTNVKKFPNVILANVFGFEQEVYFQIDEKNSEVPNVSFE